MTREEKQKAIDAVERLNALKQFIGYDKDSEIVKTTQKSIDMAIKALEQEPCEDCISRQAVIDIAEGYTMINKCIVDKVKKLPSIQPKPKYVAVGNVNFDKDKLQKIVDEAIPTIMPEIEYKKAHWQNNACSNCGIYNASAYKNWCPNCGCQMTEETE